MSVTIRLLHSGAPVHTFCIGVWPCNNSFVTLMGGHICQDLMEQTICSTGGSFEVRSEYITIFVVPVAYRQKSTTESCTCPLPLIGISFPYQHNTTVQQAEAPAKAVQS